MPEVTMFEAPGEHPMGAHIALLANPMRNRHEGHNLSSGNRHRFVRNGGSRSMRCDDASKAAMKTDIMAVNNESMKKRRPTTMKMAGSMKAGKMDDCMMHMKEAEKAMGKM